MKPVTVEVLGRYQLDKMTLDEISKAYNHLIKKQKQGKLPEVYQTKSFDKIYLSYKSAKFIRQQYGFSIRVIVNRELELIHPWSETPNPREIPEDWVTLHIEPILDMPNDVCSFL